MRKERLGDIGKMLTLGFTFRRFNWIMQIFECKRLGIKVLALVLLSVAFSSCTKELDLNDEVGIPESEAITDVISLEQSATAMYAALRDPFCLYGAFRLWPEVLSGHTLVNENNILSDELDIYSRNISPTNKLVERNWQSAYRVINRANNIINRIESGELSLSSDTLNYYLAEALFCRAIMHFELVRLYAEPYDASKINSQRGIILRTTPTDGIEPQGFVSVEEVYTSVRSDLTRAKDLITVDQYDPKTTPTGLISKGRTTKIAINAYLVRVMFQQNKPEEDEATLALLDSILDGYVYEGLNEDLSYPPFTGMSLGTRNPFNAQGPTDLNPGTAFQLTNENVNSSSYRFVNERFHASTSQLPHYFPSNQFFVNAEWDDNHPFARFVYSAGSLKDKRVFFIDQELLPDTVRNGMFEEFKVGDTTRRLLRKYRLNGMNMPVIRISELLLNRAELLAKKGDISTAIEWVNYIRSVYMNFSTASRREGYNPVIEPAAVEDAIELIRKERIRELCFEGDYLHYIKRIKGKISAGDGDYGRTELDWDSPKLVFPIPSSELVLNSSN